jgi:hypothetical protein
MIALVRKLFWLALFLVFTFCFVVLFEHGTANFTENAEKEFAELQRVLSTPLQKKADDSDAVAR